jgi:outer membrane protein OmpA-like peptidoglycan-associated protein
MHFYLPVVTGLGLILTVGAEAQTRGGEAQSVPLYRVTVVERTVPAINYQYRTGPTNIDFRGTVLMPNAKGEAVVESKAGRTEIDARFEHVDAATKYGREYLTYVLWAVTPDGHARNLGEVLTGHSDKGHLRVTTDLQAFGLIVTAEPYGAVRLPSDVVVLQNEVRPDTVGNTQPIKVKYELMPRGAYTYNVPAAGQPDEGRKVSMDRYQSLLELYQAQNAVQIAQSQGAAEYAPEVFARAQEQLRSAKQLADQKAGTSQVVTAARQAAETAEDARAVAMARRHDSELAQARAEADTERQKLISAQAAAQQAQSEAAAEKQELEAERTARRQAEAAAQQQAAAAEQVTQAAQQQVTEAAKESASSKADRADVNAASGNSANREKLDLRVSLLQELNGALETTDTPRGLVITLPDGSFRGGSLNPVVAARVSRVAAIVRAHPGLSIAVEGNTDAAGTEADAMSRHRAEAVRAALVESGLNANAVTVRSLGNTRPVTSNATESGREQNRRVDVVIAGPDIGTLAWWDKAYTIKPR